MSAVERTLSSFLLLLLGIFLCSGCHRTGAPGALQVQVSVSFDPDPPVTGSNRLTITLKDAGGEPVRLGAIEVEGNMNHAGMRPVFARLQERSPGEYSGTIEFTMGGDWILLLTSEPGPDGALREKLDVPGVKAR